MRMPTAKAAASRVRDIAGVAITGAKKSAVDIELESHVFHLGQFDETAKGPCGDGLVHARGEFQQAPHVLVGDSALLACALRFP